MAEPEDPAINQPRLIRVDGPERVAHLLAEGTTRIGRSLGADIVLEDTRVSRFQCYLVRDGDEVRVFEGESRNPSRVNGEPASGQLLRNGHQLQVGKVRFVYEGPLRLEDALEPTLGPEPERQGDRLAKPPSERTGEGRAERSAERRSGSPSGSLLAPLPRSELEPLTEPPTGSLSEPPSEPGVRLSSRRAPMASERRYPPEAAERRELRARRGRRPPAPPGSRIGPLWLAAIVVGGAAALGFFAFGLPALLRDREGTPYDSTGDSLEARRVAELERSLIQLEQRLLEARRAGSAESPAPILEKIQELESELRLARERAFEERESAGGDTPGIATEGKSDPPSDARGAPGRVGGGSGPMDVRIRFPEREPPAEPSAPSPRNDDGAARGSSESADVTLVRPSPAKALRADEVQPLVAELCGRIDDYATLSVTPGSLEPELGRLAASGGSFAPRGLLQTYRHAERLLKQVDASIEENRLKAEALLAKARAMEPSSKQPSTPRPGAGYPPEAGQTLEQLQRTLEAYRKAVEIHGVHREHLAPLRKAVFAALAGRQDPDSLLLLKGLFQKDLAPELSLLALGAFRQAAFRPAIPALASLLRQEGDPALRDATLAALRSICGEDLGASPTAWEEWWREHGQR